MTREEQVLQVQAEAVKILARYDEQDAEFEREKAAYLKDLENVEAKCEKLRAGHYYKDCSPEVQAKVDALYAVLASAPQSVQDRLPEIRNELATLLATVRPEITKGFYAPMMGTLREMVATLPLLDERDEFRTAVSAVPADGQKIKVGDFLYVGGYLSPLTHHWCYRVARATDKTLWCVNPLLESDGQTMVRRSRLKSGVFYISPEMGARMLAFHENWNKALEGVK